MAVATCAATALERRRPLPVDRIIPDPLFTSTHAVTIDATPEQVWPWIAQMGAGRGGWYSCDAIDNGGTPSATRVVPELQTVIPGDVMPAVPAFLSLPVAGTLHFLTKVERLDADATTRAVRLVSTARVPPPHRRCCGYAKDLAPSVRLVVSRHRGRRLLRRPSRRICMAFSPERHQVLLAAHTVAVASGGAAALET